jgi:hypothetical protein
MVSLGMSGGRRGTHNEVRFAPSRYLVIGFTSALGRDIPGWAVWQRQRRFKVSQALGIIVALILLTSFRRRSATSDHLM